MSTKTKEYILTESGNHISRRGLNLINTQAIVLGGKSIIRPHVTIRGDLKRPTPAHRRTSQATSTGTAAGPGAVEGAAVVVGRYCLLEEGSRMIPPYKLKPPPFPVPPSHPSNDGTEKEGQTEDDKRTGEGEEAETEDVKCYYPMKLGDYIRIGRNTTLSAASIASFVWIGNDCDIGNMSIIKEGAVIEDGTHLAPFSVVAPFSRVAGRPGLVVGECAEVTVDVIRRTLRENYAKVVGDVKIRASRR